MSTVFGYDDIFQQHRTGDHVESPARLLAIVQALKREKLLSSLVSVTDRVEPEQWIRAIHSQEYIDRLEASCRSGLPFIDCPDSAICDDSFMVAKEAIAVTLAACDMIVAEKAKNGFCALRPPGHHAEHDRSMGFCLFNNIAIACRYLQSNHKLKRILILDWDVHHGNGTQHSFEKDDTVFYCSLHQHPATLYPGTGWPDEMGKGQGRGFTLNLTMEPGATDDDCLDLFHTNFMPVANDFRPDFILISAGFDAHKKDPLAQLRLTERAYEVMTNEIIQLAMRFCNGRVLSLLEGGYQLGALGNSVVAHTKSLLV